MRTIIVILLSLIVGLLALVFGGTNDQPIKVNFLLFELTSNLAHVIAVSFFAGLLLGSGLFSIKALLRSFSARRQKHKVEKLEKEVAQLRTVSGRDQY